MTYVMSDLHGEYEKYLAMLRRINFSTKDTLYILGDICDRGNNSAMIYLDIIKRIKSKKYNIIVIKGNHEDMAEKHLRNLIEEFSTGDINPLELRSRKELWNWYGNGGEETVLSIFKECNEDRYLICNFIESLSHYQIAEVNGKKYVMMHGGFDIKPENATIDDIANLEPKELMWSCPEFDATYFNDDNTYLIVGHTPTIMLRVTLQEASIFRGKGNVIDVDCGAVFSDFCGRLGCLCLDTNQEFYV